MSVYHNVNPYNKSVYYKTDLDKTLSNSIEKDRFFENSLTHSSSGVGSSIPVPNYNFDIVEGVKRFGDERHRAKINRRHQAFLSNHSDFITSAPLN